MLLAGMTIVSLVTAVLSCLGSGLGLHWLWVAPLSFLGFFLGLLVLAFLFILVACLIVDTQKPQEHDNRFYRTMMHLYIDMILTIARVRIHATGLEQTPKSGRFLLVCNHIHDTDPAMLLTCFRKSQLAFIGKQETRDMFMVGPMMHRILSQFLNRENDSEALKTILNCIRIIKEDEASIAVFPEGYIKPDRKLHRFRSGVFKIATKTNVPIVVCTLTGTLDIFKNLFKLKPTDVHMHLLKTIQPEEYAGMTTVEIADMVYHMMADDLGPDRVAQEEIS